MMNKKILLPLFVLLVMAQFYVPAKMILDRNDVLNTGIAFKFKTAPVDPYDPFRGKYITLRFTENSVSIENPDDWKRHEEVYVLLENDEEGFAQFKAASKVKPEHNDFLKTTVRSVRYNSKTLIINCPFDRYYMEESKALDAEKIYWNTRVDTAQAAYAVVYIKDGESVLNDVMVNGKSIREIVKENQQENNLN